MRYAPAEQLVALLLELGAALALHVHIVAPLAIALVVTAAVALVAWRAGASDPDWVNPG